MYNYPLDDGLVIVQRLTVASGLGERHEDRVVIPSRKNRGEGSVGKDQVFDQRSRIGKTPLRKTRLN
jgi:hypothetical protein